MQKHDEQRMEGVVGLRATPAERYARRDALENAYGFGKYAGTEVVFDLTECGFTVCTFEGADSLGFDSDGRVCRI